jgi:hypothetical protein
MAERVHIGELRVRASGLTPAAARSLGERITAELAAGMGAAKPGRTLSSIRIRTLIPAGASQSQLPAEIARAILRSLR